MQNVYRRPKKPVVSLTSLLDLLFVMIFVSLIQQKAVVPTKTKTKKKTPTKAKPVKVNYSIDGLFYFYGTAQNPSIPTGSYNMSGKFNKKTGKLRLGGASWVNRPKNYDMVPLSGVIDKSFKMFTGKIEFQGCKKFTLRKTGKGSGRSPISGTWEGIYDCSQGMTGLTLTIK